MTVESLTRKYTLLLPLRTTKFRSRFRSSGLRCANLDLDFVRGVALAFAPLDGEGFAGAVVGVGTAFGMVYIIGVLSKGYLLFLSCQFLQYEFPTPNCGLIVNFTSKQCVATHS